MGKRWRLISESIVPYHGFYYRIRQREDIWVIERRKPDYVSWLILRKLNDDEWRALHLQPDWWEGIHAASEYEDQKLNLNRS